MLENQGYKHTLAICNTHCYSNAKMVTRTLLYDTSYVHYLSCLIPNLTDHTVTAKVKDGYSVPKHAAADSHRELCCMICVYCIVFSALVSGYTECLEIPASYLEQVDHSQFAVTVHALDKYCFHPKGITGVLISP